NDISVCEYGECMFMGQLFGIVPIFASGCVAFTKEAEALASGIETVAVKEGVMHGSGDECDIKAYEKRNWGAVHLQPQKARELIREGAYRALKRYIEAPASFKPVHISAPYSKRIVFREVNGKTNYVVEAEGYDDLAKLLNGC
ncbi:MAG: M55 family metallopeptidase, partial [Clostridia bacterium]|nr:M55 family metallopeptidase [Clostridia bacterium]